MTPQAARPDHERPAPTNTHTPADLTRWALGVTLPRSPQMLRALAQAVRSAPTTDRAALLVLDELEVMGND